jgi:hypothetical protein
MSDGPPADRERDSGLALMVVSMGAIGLLCLGVIGGAGYFALRAFREAAVRQEDVALVAEHEEEYARSASQLRTIAKAMAEAPSYPADILDARGQPILSWRVDLLPALGEHELWKQFRRDEPWDGPNNRQLIARMPAAYVPPGRLATERETGRTYFRGFSHDGAFFDPKWKRPARVATAVTAGTSHVIAIFEAGESIEWTRPDRLVWPADRARPELGGLFPERASFLAATADGEVHAVKRSLPDPVLRALFDWRHEMRPKVRFTSDMREE